MFAVVFYNVRGIVKRYLRLWWEKKMEKKEKVNYVDKLEFLEALRKYKTQCREAEEAGDDRPDVPKYIGESLWAISKGISSRGNFSNYPFKDDMIMDGVENCLTYLHNFDPTKSNNPNPFGYFTKIIWYAFLRRIAKEKKQMYIRFKLSNESPSLGDTYEGDDFFDMSGGSSDYMNDFIEHYETKLEEAKVKSRLKKQFSKEEVSEV